VALAVLGFLPLFGGPSYESALGAGALLPSIASVATAIEVARRRPQPFDALARGAASGLMVACVALLVTLVHGARVGFCDPWPDIALWLLAPMPGAVLGGAWGGLSALLAPRRPRWGTIAAIALGLAGPIGGIAISLLRFYTSPMVFAFDPFFGFFAGTLYDTVFDPVDELTSYRVGSACSLLAAAVACAHLERREDGRIRPVWRGRPGAVLVAGVALSISLAITLKGPALGHWQTVGSIKKELERSAAGERCDLLYPPNIIERDARLMLRDCDAHVAGLERYFGARGPERITVFLFASVDQKAHLMGAGNTYIAKPWRAEIYLQPAAYPHPVLGHELAHVVAGGFGAGPFKVSGPLRGLIPDPGRIEGVAVAAAPDEDDDLTIEQWARAMLDLGLLPPLERVFKLSFLGENSAKAYTVAGAFIHWLHDAHGAEAVRRWYGGTDLAAVTGKGLPELEQEWRQALQAVTVSPEAMHTARARFDRPAIFGRRCPHVVDAFEQQAAARLGMGDATGCREGYERVLALDPEHVRARIGLAGCAFRAGDLAQARERYATVASDPKLPKLHQATAEEALGDLDLAAGKVADAVRRYSEVRKAVVDDDRLRTLDVKSQPGSELGRKAIVNLLIGEPELGASWDVAIAQLGELAGTDAEQGLADYLIGRNLFLRGRFRDAAFHLDRALARPLSIDRVRAEALRNRIVVGCALDDRAAAKSAYERWLEEPGVTAARRDGMARFAERCGLSKLR
jgi:tetratricopeptide (TPR) repeat protein